MKYPAIVTGREYKGEIDSYSQLVSANGPYLEPGEFLYLEASSTDASATLRLSGKFLSADNEIRSFSEDMVITGTGNQTAVTSRIGPCWLMGFSVRVVAGTITDGEIVASVHVARAGASTPVHVMTLASGEVTNTRALGMGAFLIRGAESTTAQPTIVTTLISNPAAGDEAIFTVTASEVWEVQSVFLKLVTSATAGNRAVAIIVDDGTNILFEAEASVLQAASQTYFYNFSAVGAIWSPAATNVYQIASPRLMLGAGYRIRTETTNQKVDDQYSLCSICYRQY